ncbi:MAG TPA: polysaccharide deacetylase family protein [Streptosporangiaceae bacterium]|nr:polysaccharide deacetylase family protein [Streptosporangiaceae bacterium]
MEFRATAVTAAVFFGAVSLAANGAIGAGSQSAAGATRTSGTLASWGLAARTLRPGVRAVGLAADPATGGYWILRSSGGVDGFHAPWRGSLLGKIPAGSAVTAIAASRSGGYLILTSNGGVHAFGTGWFGSDAYKLPAGVTATGLAADPATGGYWILRSTGAVDAFHAPRRGSLAGKIPFASTLTAIAAGRPGGYLILTSTGGKVPAGLRGRQWDVIPTSRKIVALTFDIGPTSGVRSILATLRRDHVRATFFLVGGTARRSPATAQAIAAAGQLVGDHSSTHPHFTRITDASIRQQVRGAQTEITSLTGLDPWPWFRFPFGDHNARTIAAVNSAGFVPIGWTVDTLGWMGTSGGITVRTVVNRVLANRRPGEIVLMHGGSDAHDNSTLDADALPTVISKLRADGYSFVTIDALRGFSSRVRASNGKVAAFGTPWYGSLANRLPVGVRAVGLAADPATGGYWILKSTGAISAFRAPWRGSLASKVPAGSALTALAAGRPGGYLILTANGAVYNFGTPWYGSDANQLPRT